MSDWQVGDLALCIKRDAWRGNPSGRVVHGPAYGSVHKVTWVGLCRGGRLCLELEGVETERNHLGTIPWNAGRFRKIRPDEHEACEEEFRILLKLSKQRVSA